MEQDVKAAEGARKRKAKDMDDGAPRKRRGQAQLPEGVLFDEAAKVWALVAEHAAPMREALGKLEPRARAYAHELLIQALS